MQKGARRIALLSFNYTIFDNRFWNRTHHGRYASTFKTGFAEEFCRQGNVLDVLCFADIVYKECNFTWVFSGPIVIFHAGRYIHSIRLYRCDGLLYVPCIQTAG